jgi:hypothetical protein
MWHLGLFLVVVRLLSCPVLMAQSSSQSLAEELLDTMQVEKLFTSRIDNVFTEALNADPQNAQKYGPAIREKLSWSAIKPEFASILLTSYNEADIRGLIAFYRSPLGLKVVASQSSLEARFGEVTNKRFLEATSGWRNQAVIAANEGIALASMRTIGSACLLYRTTNGEFPTTLDDLEKEGLIDKVLGTGVRSGYRFAYRKIGNPSALSQMKFSVTAVPLEPGKTGNAQYYNDQTQTIRSTSAGTVGPTSAILEK